MTEQADQQPAAAGTSPGEPPVLARRDTRIRLIAWAGLSLAFLAFVLAGSVGARTWRAGFLFTDSRSIARIWEVQIDLLPPVSPGWLVQAAYIASLVVFVVGVVAGLYLLVQPEDDGDVRAADPA